MNIIKYIVYMVFKKCSYTQKYNDIERIRGLKKMYFGQKHFPRIADVIIVIKD